MIDRRSDEEPGHARLPPGDAALATARLRENFGAERCRGLRDHNGASRGVEAGRARGATGAVGAYWLAQ